VLHPFEKEIFRQPLMTSQREITDFIEVVSYQSVEPSEGRQRQDHVNQLWLVDA
jgi:hypothetical protein